MQFNLFNQIFNTIIQHLSKNQVNIMQDRQLLILKILKIPVKIIIWGSRFASMLTYLPNYFIILILDLLLFNQNIDTSLLYYCLAWPFRLALLQLIPALFVAEFSLIFYLLDLSGRQLWIQVLAMFLVLVGAITLMRKGYLSFIKQFDPMKLKSPMEHLFLYGQYFLNLIGLLCAIFNILLVVNAIKTFAYDYSKTERRYLKFINQLIRQSILSIIKFFYVKIFFRLFSWRYNASLQHIKKQEKNILNLFVLLTILYIETCIDIVFLIVLGWIPMIHPKRSKYLENLRSDCRWWRVIISFNGFIISQLVQLVLIILGIIKWTRYKQVLKKICNEETIKDNHFKQVFKLLFLAAVQVPYLICLFTIYIFRYKYKKRAVLMRAKADQTEEFLTFFCFGDLILESIYLPLIVLATVLKPWRYSWLKMLVDENHDLKGSFILSYFAKTISDVFWLLCCLVLAIFLLYSPWQVYQRLKAFWNLSKAMTEKQIIEEKSLLRKMSQNFFVRIQTDFLIFKVRFISKKEQRIELFQIKLPQQFLPNLQEILSSAQISRSQKSPQYQKYLQMYKKDAAAGFIKNQTSKLRFWTFINKAQKYQKIMAIQKMFLPKRGTQKIQRTINDQPQERFSSLSNHYWKVREIYKAINYYIVYLVISTILTIFGVVFMLPITLWRIPTFCVIYLKHKSKLLFFKIILKMYKQLAIDIYFFFTIQLWAFILSPRYFMKYKVKQSFYYGQDGINTFDNVQNEKRKIIKQILTKSIEKWIILIKTILIILMLVELKHFRNRLKEQNASIAQVLTCYFQMSVPNIYEKMKVDGKSQQYLNQSREKLKKVRQIIDQDFVLSLRSLRDIIIQTILTLIAIFVLLPLTLWRLPTFFVLFLKHKSKKLVFRIILVVYKQMLIDVLSLLFYLPGLIISPRHYLTQKIRNAFYYGKKGFYTFEVIQHHKQRILRQLTVQSFKRLSMLFKAMMICLMWVRFRFYREQLLKVNTSFFNVIKISMQCQVKTAIEIEESQDKQDCFKICPDYNMFKRTDKLTKAIFNDAIRDLPYLLVLLLIQVLMPWRIFYIKDVIVGFRQGFSNRKKFFKLLNNVMKDYLCIILTFVLILSIVKAKKAIKLALKNIRLNFFVGFLKYSYFQQLLNQLYQAGWFYNNALFLLLALIIDWPRAPNMINIVYQQYKKRRQDQKVKQDNQKIHQRSVQQGKQLKILSKMGYNGFLTLCQYLNMEQIASLSRVNKLCYQMTKQQEIWMSKWQRNYQKDFKDKIKNTQNYEEMCIQAYQLSKVGKKAKKVTYQDIILNQFHAAVKQRHLDFKQLGKIFLQQQLQRRLFSNARWDPILGFLQPVVADLNHDQDDQVLRLLARQRNQPNQAPPQVNQIERPLNQLVQMDQAELFVHYLVLKPVEFTVSLPTYFLIHNSHRRKKQVLFLLSIPMAIVFYLASIYQTFFYVFTFDPLFAIKILLVFYLHAILCLFLYRCNYMYRHQWNALDPFDLKTDAVEFFIRQKQRTVDGYNAVTNFIRRKLVEPTTNKYRAFKAYISRKIALLKRWFRQKVYVPAKNWFQAKKQAAIDRAIMLKNRIKEFILKCWQIFQNAVLWLFRKIKNGLITIFKFFYNNIARPLYLYISEKIVIFSRFMVEIFRFFKRTIILIARKIGNLFINIFLGIKTIITSMNSSYKFILEESLKFSLKFGMVGELIFTIFCLVLMCLPFIGSYLFYWQRWFIITASVWTMALILSGYRHLSRAKQNMNKS